MLSAWGAKMPVSMIVPTFRYIILEEKDGRNSVQAARRGKTFLLSGKKRIKDSLLKPQVEERNFVQAARKG